MSKTTQFNFVPLKTGPSGRSISPDVLNPQQTEEEKTYKEAEYKAAIAENYEKGKAEGMTLGIEQSKSEAFALEKQIADGIGLLVQKAIDSSKIAEAEIINKSKYMETISLMISKKVAGELISENIETKVTEIVRKVLPEIYNKKSLLVLLSERDAGVLKEKIGARIEEQGFSGKVEVKVSKKVADGDCTLCWDEGSVEFNKDRLLGDIAKIIGGEIPVSSAPAQQDAPAAPPPAQEETPASNQKESEQHVENQPENTDSKKEEVKTSDNATEAEETAENK